MEEEYRILYTKMVIAKYRFIIILAGLFLLLLLSGIYVPEV